MAWRFKASKFKNTTAKQPKKEDTLYSIRPAGGTSTSNGVQCGRSLLAYTLHSADAGANATRLAVVPVTARGSCDRHTHVAVLQPHADQLSDFTFLPFEHSTLVTCGADSTVKVWKHEVSGDCAPAAVNTGSMHVGDEQSVAAAECLAPHPGAHNVLAVGVKGARAAAALCDLAQGAVAMSLERKHSSDCETSVSTASMSWSSDGRTLATGQKSGAPMARQTSAIYDPRAHTAPVHQFATHGCCGKETRVVHLGDSGKLLSSGFTNKRSQELQVFDVRTLSNDSDNNRPIFSQEFATSTGLLIPLYDEDTKLLFLAGKGSTTVTIMELLDTNAVIGPVSTHVLPTGQGATLGACLSAKQSLDVMCGEVQRLWHMASHALTPIPCVVPRRTYRNFLPELFADAVCDIPGCTAAEWLNGCNDLPPRFSLDPDRRAELNVCRKMEAPVIRIETNGVAIEADNNENALLPQVPCKQDECVSSAPPRRSARLANKNEPAAAAVPSVRSKVDAFNNNSPLRRPDAGPPPFVTKIEVCGTPDATGDNTFNDSDFKTPAESLTPLAVKTAKFFDDKFNDDETPHNHKGINDGRRLLRNEQRSPADAECDGRIVEGAGESGEKDGGETCAAGDASLAENHQHTIGDQSAMSELMDDIADLPIFAADDKKETVSRRGRPSMEPRQRPVTIVSAIGGVRHSKYRHVKSSTVDTFSNIRRVDTGVPADSDGLCVSGKWAALPLAGPPVGMVMVILLSEPCKLPDGVPAALCNGAKVCDLRWSPHHDDLLAVGLADGQVKLWLIPEVGVTDDNANELVPAAVIHASPSKVTHVRWHPVVSALLCVASSDGALSMWNVEAVLHTGGNGAMERVMELDNDGALLSVCWSAGGRRLATVGKDKRVRLYKPLESLRPVADKADVIGRDRAARCMFACDDRLLLVVGFASGGARRQLTLLDGYTLERLHEETMGEPSSQPLVPFYDYDSSVLFLTTKGERRIVMHELCASHPWLLPLSDAVLPNPAVAIAYHQKNVCDVTKVEFARGWLLTDKTLEQLSFTVPRRETDTFAMDIFPKALVTWRPNGTAAHWLALAGDSAAGDSAQCKPLFESLRPDGMPLPRSSEPAVNGHAAADTKHGPAVAQQQPQWRQAAAGGPQQRQSHNGDTEQHALGKASHRSLPHNCKVVGRRRLAHTAHDDGVKEMENDLILSMAEAMAAPRMSNKKLEQDDMEGVHEDEWNQ